MPERIGNYTEEESNELWEAWANQLAIGKQQLAEEFVKQMIEGEADGAE
ncbi:MAG TPA: hypothetical protein VFP32_04190 [Candidatus Saccharimonadales bacterium]|nr:hypothetical protein [Candidatus Saccharimonadales bacterium]